MARIKHGIVFYTVEKNGCLNGVYANEVGNGEISNEIARKCKKTRTPPIVGEYDSAYFEVGNTDIVHTVKLHIDRKENKKNVFDFRWMQGDVQKFTGIGYKIDANKIAVHYWEGK